MPGVTVFGYLDGVREETEGRIRDCQAVSLDIEPVSPAAEGLSQHKPGGDDVAESQSRKAAFPAEQKQHQETADDAAVNGQAAFPDAED